MALLKDLLAGYNPYDAEEEACVSQLLQFLEYGWNHYDRSNLTAHIIADAWIVNPLRSEVVLLQSVASGIWGASGGHCDGNPDVYLAAVREAEEETGLTQLKPLLEGRVFDISTGILAMRQKAHGIEPPHVHFNICFAFEAPHGAELHLSDESINLKWVPIGDIRTYNTFVSHARRFRKMMDGVLG